MTIAYADLETQLAAIEREYAQVASARETLPQAPLGSRPVRLLICARTRAFGARISAQMAQDDAVNGVVCRGTFAQIVAHRGPQAIDWSAWDFVVFEARAEAAAYDCAVIAALMGRADHLQVIAMVAGEITPHLRATYLEAGARDVVADTHATPDEGAPETQGVAPAADVTPITAPITVPPTPAAPETLSSADGSLAEPAVTASPHMAQPRQMDTGLGAVTLILRARGGAGASTVATNLAIAQARFGTVALVDLDIQNGSIGTLLDLPDSAAFTRVIQSQDRADAAFCARAMQQHSSGIDVLAAPDVFAPMTSLTPDLIADLFEALRARYDHVIVDLPQAVMDWFAPLLESAARAIIVTDTSVPSIKRTKRLIEVLTEDHMTLPVTVVVNAEKRPFVQSAAIKEAARVLDRALTHWIPLDAVAMRRARDMGVPVIVGAKRSGLSRAFFALSDAIRSKRHTKAAA
ncbi:CpaE family protein [Albirhodobacter sp. R86504]|uniref:AAA family ATPase n=1 Tax=Albirhodobacter sp. R86504 TaxID=3093848 RepID=UPI00366BD8F1